MIQYELYDPYSTRRVAAVCFTYGAEDEEPKLAAVEVEDRISLDVNNSVVLEPAEHVRIHVRPMRHNIEHADQLEEPRVWSVHLAIVPTRSVSMSSIPPNVEDWSKYRAAIPSNASKNDDMK